mgnify:CR=1 FL=1
MKYALQSDERIEATPKASGSCPCCETEVTAVCGTRKVWHWRHKNKLICDHWWENETQWHRDWKDHFFKEWQEVVHVAEGGEKHIADVKTPSGLVIEFQHSHIKPDEQLAREKYYQNMLWIVDGKRLKYDFSRFDNVYGGWRLWGWDKTQHSLNHLYGADLAFPKSWLMSSVPVIFDWGMDSGGGHLFPVLSENLICLLPAEKHDRPRKGFAVRRDNFIQAVIQKQALDIPVE